MYCIVYELKNAEKDYSPFYQQIKELGNSNQFIANGWFVVTKLSKEEIFEQLKPLLDAPDLLLISNSNLSNMSGWLPRASIDWLKSNNV